MNHGRHPWPKRKQLRWKAHDYRRGGAYLVTVCVLGGGPLLGRVVGDQVEPTPEGRLVEDAWSGLSERFRWLRVDAFVVMPDHFHGILFVEPPSLDDVASAGTHPLGKVMRAFKSVSGRAINRSLGRRGRRVWLRGYHDRVLRRPSDIAGARRYIALNPTRWHRH